MKHIKLKGKIVNLRYEIKFDARGEEVKQRIYLRSFDGRTKGSGSDIIHEYDLLRKEIGKESQDFFIECGNQQIKIHGGELDKMFGKYNKWIGWSGGYEVTMRIDCETFSILSGDELIRDSKLKELLEL